MVPLPGCPLGIPMRGASILALALLATVPAAAAALGVDTPVCTIPGPGGAYLVDCGTGNVVPGRIAGIGFTVGNDCANVRAQAFGRFVVVGGPCPR